ncbi:MAG: hypothetical protein SXA11_06855 [Cyanobacteriota bacterium]|nr:hypothetical protein [Cyanobacteriota bacterium]
MALDSQDGRLGAWISAGLLTGTAAIAVSWCLNSRSPLLKIATGIGSTALGGIAILALTDCDDAARYKRVLRETEYQKFLAAAQAGLRQVVNYLLAAAPLSTESSPAQFSNIQFAALPPGEEQMPELDIRQLVNYPTVRVTGPQGAGKSRIAEEITRLRCEAGYKAIIIDPHCKYGQWEGLEVVGKGQDYKTVERWIAWFTGEIKDRYQKRATEPNYNPPPMTIVCEELTGWKKNGVKNAGELEIASYSDTRKVNIAITFIAHGKTSELMGGGKGLAKTRAEGAADIEVLNKIDEYTKKAVPKLEGILKLPGQEAHPVKIPHLSPLPPGAFKTFGGGAIAPAPADSDKQNRFNLAKLEQSYSIETTADALPPDEWEILKIGIEQKGILTIREVLRCAPGRRLKLNAENCALMFARWAEFNFGTVKTHQLPNGQNQLRFVIHSDR